MTDWLKKISQFLFDLFKDAIAAVLEMLKDVVLWVLEQFLNGIAYVLSLLPAPDFLQNVSLGDLLSGLPPYALYVIGHMNFPAAFSIVGAGLLFNLGRKLATLGQW